jgi:starch phosphorylase
VTLGGIDPDSVQVELYADALANDAMIRVPMERRESLPGLANTGRYEVELRTSRPVWHFTARVLPRRDGVSVPTEIPLIAWERR